LAPGLDVHFEVEAEPELVVDLLRETLPSPKMLCYPAGYQRSLPLTSSHTELGQYSAILAEMELVVELVSLMVVDRVDE
jgi:hypothetical protein